MFGLFCYQQVLIRARERQGCLRAFLNNTWVGFVFFVGVVLETQADAPRHAAFGGGAA